VNYGMARSVATHLGRCLLSGGLFVFLASCGSSSTPVEDAAPTVGEPAAAETADGTEACLDPLSAEDDMGHTDRWVEINDPLTVLQESKLLPPHLVVTLPADAISLVAGASDEAGWASVERRPGAEDLGEIVIIGDWLPPVQEAKGPVLLGLGHHVVQDVWRIRVSYDVLDDESLVRQVTCAPSQKRGTSELWDLARADGFLGTELDLMVTKPTERIDELLVAASASATVANLASMGDPNQIGVGDTTIDVIVVPHDGSPRGFICVGQVGDDRKLDHLCMSTTAEGGATYTHPMQIDGSRDLQIFSGGSDGQQVGEPVVIPIGDVGTSIEIVMADESTFEAKS
jgi:hypothetical protein